jgi:sn-glycerol 3-phosphate transport system substrate-binding protein
MRYRKALATLVLISALTLGTRCAFAATEILFWHSMTGTLREQVENLAARFNQTQANGKTATAGQSMPALGNSRVYWSQSNYKIIPVYKGNYDKTMAALLTAAKTGATPHIVQIFDIGTADMMAAGDETGRGHGSIIKPIHEVMAIGGQRIIPEAYLPAIAGYYTDAKGRLLSLPFNSSTPALFINKDAFRKAGLNPDQPPRTWLEMAIAAAKLKAHGSSCVYTTGWQSWIHLENAGALHDQAFASQDNGFSGTGAKLLVDAPFYVTHIAMLADWREKGWFSYFGRKNDSEEPFYKGECAMLTDSTAAYGDIAKNAHFDFSISPLPYHGEVKGAPRNTLIGGASLWVTSGKTLDEYKGVAKFLNFLSQREVQAEWHQQTGYLPISEAAYELSRKQGFYDKNPGIDTPLRAMMAKPQTANSKGIRLRNFVQIRTIIDEELEAVWNQSKPPKRALEDIVNRSNPLLRQ